MPKETKKSISQQNIEFQKKEFPARMRVVKKKATTALAAHEAVGKEHKSLSVEERGRHQKALKAVGRIEKRLGTGIAPSRDAVTKPGKTKKTRSRSTPESRRKPFESATPFLDPLRKLNGIKNLVKAGKKKNGG